MVPQVYVPTTNTEEAEVELFYADLQDLLANIQKRCPFHHRVLECKSRKSRDAWSNRQIWPRSTKRAGQRVTQLSQENALVIAKTLFHEQKRRLYT